METIDAMKTDNNQGQNDRFIQRTHILNERMVSHMIGTFTIKNHSNSMLGLDKLLIMSSRQFSTMNLSRL